MSVGWWLMMCRKYFYIVNKCIFLWFAARYRLVIISLWTLCGWLLPLVKRNAEFWQFWRCVECDRLVEYGSTYDLIYLNQISSYFSRNCQLMILYVVPGASDYHCVSIVFERLHFVMPFIHAKLYILKLLALTKTLSFNTPFVLVGEQSASDWWFCVYYFSFLMLNDATLPIHKGNIKDWGCSFQSKL